MSKRNYALMIVCVLAILNVILYKQPSVKKEAEKITNPNILNASEENKDIIKSINDSIQISRLQQIEENRNKAIEKNKDGKINYTDKISENLIQNYFKTGGISDGQLNKDAVANDIANQVSQSALQYIAVERSALKTKENMNNIELAKYYTDFYYAVMKPLQDLSKNKGKTDMSTLTNMYKKHIDNLTKMTVPTELSYPHLDIINTYVLTIEVGNSIDQYEKDPVKALIAMQTQQENNKRADDSLKIMVTYLKNSDIFITDENANKFWKALSK